MTTQQLTTPNGNKASYACVALREILDDVLKRGFHGTASVEVAVQDGTIQHIRRRVDRIER
ncbi:MAG TPA: hypothetical protein VHD36_08465 [Pirellulales bacterium]|nr:hypothetical protein [Pirellulales bacterium]